jgi:lipoyl(octanoyl) transferase
MREPISWKWLGLCAYEHALALQDAAWTARREGGPDVCFALEHPPTITLGRRATARDVVASATELGARGIACHAIERGGHATYHAPGQLVLYPVVHLGDRGLGVRSFVWCLEEIMLRICDAVGVAATRDARGHGVWTARGKLGAVGIRVREGIATHGLALNVDIDLAGYELIAPCGVRGLPVTSLWAEGADVGVRGLLPVAEDACRRVLDRTTRATTEAHP